MRIIINISNNTVKITKSPNLNIITNILRALLMYSLIDFVFIATFCHCDRYFNTISTGLIPICQDFFELLILLISSQEKSQNNEISEYIYSVVYKKS